MLTEQHRNKGRSTGKTSGTCTPCRLCLKSGKGEGFKRHWTADLKCFILPSNVEVVKYLTAGKKWEILRAIEHSGFSQWSSRKLLSTGVSIIVTHGGSSECSMALKHTVPNSRIRVFSSHIKHTRRCLCSRYRRDALFQWILSFLNLKKFSSLLCSP